MYAALVVATYEMSRKKSQGRILDEYLPEACLSEASLRREN